MKLNIEQLEYVTLMAKGAKLEGIHLQALLDLCLLMKIEGDKETLNTVLKNEERNENTERSL